MHPPIVDSLRSKTKRTNYEATRKGRPESRDAFSNRERPRCRISNLTPAQAKKKGTHFCNSTSKTLPYTKSSKRISRPGIKKGSEGCPDTSATSRIESKSGEETVKVHAVRT